MDLEKQARERELFQDECVQLSKQHKHLLIEAATGVGKGLAVLKCIAASPSAKKWLIVVPEQIQIKNYIQDLKKHGYDWMLDIKIEDIICYASLHKYVGRKLNLAMNECHRLSDARLEVGQSFDFDQIISDSATVSYDVRVRLKALCPFHPIELPLDEAIERGILPPPAYYLIGITLNDKIRRNEKVIKGKVYTYTDLSTSKGYDRQMNIWDERIQSLIDEGKPYEWARNIKIRIGSERKKFLASCKTEKAKELLLAFGDSRFVAFCGSVEQAEALGADRSISSSRGKKHNEETIRKFHNFEINSLYMNKMGNEGMNHPNIEKVLVVQLDSGNDGGLSFIQKSGRGMRAEMPEIWIIYCKGTQDEVFLKKALQNINKKYINYV